METSSTIGGGELAVLILVVSCACVFPLALLTWAHFRITAAWEGLVKTSDLDRKRLLECVLVFSGGDPGASLARSMEHTTQAGLQADVAKETGKPSGVRSPIDGRRLHAAR